MFPRTDATKSHPLTSIPSTRTMWRQWCWCQG